MVNWKTIDELREIFINKYIDSNLQSELEKACSEEYELKRDYNGRQILELLQNVDDACEELKTKDEVVVKFTFKDNILEVGNTGTTFSDETIERLCLGRASEKSSKKIGNKGTGFRSLLNDAEWIEIHSGKHSVRFSETFTKKLFDKYCDKPLIANQIHNWKKDYNFYFPVMNCPEAISFDSKCFDTLIRVKVKTENENKETSIKKQLEQPFYKSLLFLPNITKIIIETESETKEYSKIIDGEDVLIEELIDSEKTDKAEEYYVYEDKTSIEGKEADIIIAVPKDTNYDFSNEKLYCYFPIRSFSTPINALIHAPFSTNNSRDDVPDDSEQINRKIFLKVIDFIKNVSEELALHDEKNLALKTIIPLMNSKLWSSDSFNLKNQYFELLSTAKVLPTVNNELISIKDNPKIFDVPFPKEFYGSDFKELLISLDENNNRLVKDLAHFINYFQLEYTSKELVEKINLISNKSDIITRVQLFLWWNENYKSSAYLPELLQDTNNSWIKSNSKVYLPTDGGVSVLPKELFWVKLCVLQQDYVSEIITQLKSNRADDWNGADKASQSGGDKRTLAAFSREFFSVSFIEQSSHEQIISTINQQVKSVEEAKSFINWFFDNYGKDIKDGSELSKVKYRLPSRNNNEVLPIDELYLGEDYNNSLAEKLFQDTSIKPLANIKNIYDGEELDEFILFLKKIGIKLFPEIKDESLWDKYDFRYFVSKKYVTNININYLHSKTIENFIELIMTLDTKDIVDWLDKDEKLRNLLTSQENGSYAKQQANWSPWNFASNAYIKFILNTVPWIELNGKKYSPSHIIKYEKLKDKVAGYYGIYEQNLIKYLGKDIVLNFALDFKDSMAQIPDNDIKLFLDTLPSFDSGEISRRLYLDIIKTKKGLKPAYSAENLKLLCKDGKYHFNREVKYADRKISSSEEANGNFIYIQPKQSTETIKEWLGVERYKTTLKLRRQPVILKNKNDFDLEIKSIKIAVMCVIDQNKRNIDILKRIEIIPCTEIEVLDLEQDDKSMFLENYFFVEENNLYYIKIPTDFSMDKIRISDMFSLSIIEILKQALTLSLENDTNLLELLIAKDSKAKKAKIADLFGVDSWNISNELLFNKNIANESAIKFFKENGLSTELLDSISKLDFTTDLDNSDLEVIIKALKKISKDVKDLNACSETLNVSLVHFYQSEAKNLMNSEFKKYRNNLYTEIQSKKSDYSQFLERIEAFKNYDPSKFSFENTISVDLPGIISKQFPELLYNSQSLLNPDEIYNSNVEKIISDLKITNDDFDYFIQNHKEQKSSIYFEIQDSLYDSIRKFLSNQNEGNDEKEAVKASSDNINSTTIHTKLKKSQKFYNESTHSGGFSEKCKKDYERRNTQNDNAGKSAEEIAYYELKKTYKNLIWHSKNSHIPADRNNPPPNGVVCDMWNSDSEKGNLYFEVKSSTTEFELSINEYKSMENNKDNYEVILVNRDTQEISRHKFEELEDLKRVSSYKFVFEQEKLV